HNLGRKINPVLRLRQIRQRRVRGEDRPRDLFMKPRREQQEPIMLEAESRPPLGNSAFSQNQRLTPALERFTHNRPFFESNTHTPQSLSTPPTVNGHFAG